MRPSDPIDLTGDDEPVSSGRYDKRQRLDGGNSPLSTSSAPLLFDPSSIPLSFGQTPTWPASSSTSASGSSWRPSPSSNGASYPLDSMWSVQPGAARSSGNSQHHQHVASGPHTPVESSFGQPVTLLPSQVLHMRPSGSHDAAMDSAHYRIPTTARNAPPPPPPSTSSSSASRLHHQHVAPSSSSSSSRKTTAGGRFDSPIDVDSLPSPPPQPAPKPAPPPSPSGTQPTLIGVLNTTALILYPDNYYLAPTVSLGETPKVAYAKGEVLMQDGQEWARVKLKHKKDVAGGAESLGERINVLPYGVPSSASEPFGVVQKDVANVLGGFLAKGLIRVEGWINRTAGSAKFCGSLQLFLLTIPPNMMYISNVLANSNLILNHPHIRWNPEWFQNCAYKNPHIETGVADAAASRKAALIAGLSRPGVGGASTAQRVVEQQRNQVDEVFNSLKGGDDLEETEPGSMIATKLYPHQRKAITFLREREYEKRPPTGLSKRNFKTPTFASLWEPLKPLESSRKGKSSSKPSGWEHRVTKEVIHHKPDECRGAILADDMGLGKSLTIVSLIASTLKSAGRFEYKPIDCPSPPSPTASLDASHFSGAVFGMPSSEPATVVSNSSLSSSKSKQQDAFALEQYARRSRIQVKTRGTLIVCPLTTVSNWEDQLLEHWAGPVVVFSAGGSVKKNAAAMRKTERGGSDGGGRQDGGAGGGGIGKRGGSGESSDEDSEDEEDKTLRVYVYHGPSRKSDPDYLGDFDVVITTFSTLAVEFSKQTKTGESSGSATPREGHSPAPGGGDDDDVVVTDALGRPLSAQARAIEEESKAVEKSTKKRKRGKGAVSNLVLATETEVTSPLQQIEWFRVVLDEAHFIKDANTVAARACCYLEAQRRICLTGTPIQNKLDDLWALIKFIRLAPFDNKAVWAQYISSPAKYGDSIGVARLQVLMRHITLRRDKQMKNEEGKTLLSLPPIKNVVQYLAFDEKEQAIYDKHLNDASQDFSSMLKEGAGEGGPEGAISNTNYVNILQKILRLRQICDHYLLLSDSTSADDDEASGEPLDYEQAVAAINAHGMSQRRAAAVMTFFKEESMCVCAECDVDLSCLAASVVVEEAVDGPTPVSKGGRSGKGKKKVPQAVLTKCQHLYCLTCFKKSIYSGWPKSLGGVARSCSRCAQGLRLASDCIEIVPPGSSEAAASGEYVPAAPASASRSTAASRRKKRDSGAELIMSTKIRRLMSDLMSYSNINPHSKNYHCQFQQPKELYDPSMMLAPSDGGATIQPYEEPLPRTDGHDNNSMEFVLNGEVPLANPDSAETSTAVLDLLAPPASSSAKPDIDDPFPPTDESLTIDLTHTPTPTPEDPFPELEEPYRSDINQNPSLPIKTIVFSQWTSMLDRIEDALADSGIQYDRLDGTMKRDDRTKAMERLRSDPACEVLLVSLRAGGVGLNLTTACRCYMMDPYWNPAVEDQAVDRIHRLGQKRPVIAYKFIIQGSMEDRMLEIQDKKKKLASMSLSQTMSKKELHERRMEELKTLFS